VIICDLEVLTGAPEMLFFSGAGDLLAKYFAYLDWNLSAILTGEPIEQLEAEYALSSARRAIEACRNYQEKPIDAVEALTDAILTSGLVMQGIGHSRPAASAEHTVAHFWEMTGKIKNEELDRHGILVAIASRKYIDSYTAFYNSLKNSAVDPEKRVREIEQEGPWQDKVDPVMKPYMAKMEMEMREKKPDSGLLRARLENYRKNEDKIFNLALPLLEELARMGRILENIDFPFDPEALDFSIEYYNAGFTHVRYLRDRYSSVDFAADTGYEHIICPVEKGV
jgi:glycerol-1-phosphate dehydrogenase [NAD(P)+]